MTKKIPLIVAVVAFLIALYSYFQLGWRPGSRSG